MKTAAEDALSLDRVCTIAGIRRWLFSLNVGRLSNNLVQKSALFSDNGVSRS